MLVHFHLHYFTHFGQILMLSGSASETGSLKEEGALEMKHLGDGYWHLLVDIKGTGLLDYRYFVREKGQTQRREWGENHKVGLPADTDFCDLYDFWQPEPDMAFLYTSAFTDSLLAVSHNLKETAYAPDRVILKVQAPFVRKGQCIGISGDSEIFGEWKDDKALAMQSERFPEWSLTINAKTLPETCHYKFVVLNENTGKISGWEWGEPRSLFTPRCMERQMLMHSGMTYRFQDAPWKGAGVAIPVFSLRSESSWGCGDFGDLRKMTDWAEATGLQLIQLLPVNDTTISGTWRDSYPYSAISIFALHPIYAGIGELPSLDNKKSMALYEKRRLILNALPEMDYEKVTQLKWDYFQDLFRQEGEIVLKTERFKKFFEKNCDWLVPYAAFCYLRKSQGSFDYHLWKEYSEYNAEQIRILCDSTQPWHHEIAIHYYVQYQLHLQLRAARNYAHEHSVILKGDIPIGISRYSVEAWKEPFLFNMDAQIGAPPDDFSATGQNWGFPSYNWERMKKDDYRWWKRRFQKMADYFDAYRIDHILGFFRIWEIPLKSSEGLLGHFSPAVPLSMEEMHDAGFDFDEEVMTEPYITGTLLTELFGKSAPEIKETYLRKNRYGRFRLGNEFNTQQKIRAHFEGKKTNEDRQLCKKLFSLCNEVLFVKDPQKPGFFHPRIQADKTRCYKSLSPAQKEVFDRIYLDFFYVRNVDFWKRQALEKLPVLISSTRMLACGEDLGMIPSCVPEVMHELGILSLEIQRMPKTFGVLFENLNSIPYLSVCSTSTHDMNPVRAWWHEDKDKAQQYFQQVLWRQGIAPEECDPEIAERIIGLHLASPALWVILPWQDWMSIDGHLRLPNPDAERINIPSNPGNHWRYRMHINLDKLLKERAFNGRLREMVLNAGRLLLFF